MAKRPSIWSFNPGNQQPDLVQTQDSLRSLHQQYTNLDINYETYEAGVQEIKGQSPDVFRDAIATYNNPQATMTESSDLDPALAAGSGAIQGPTDLLKYPTMALNWAASNFMSNEQENENYKTIADYYDNVGPEWFQDKRNQLREEYPNTHLAGEVGTGAAALFKKAVFNSAKGLWGKELDRVTLRNNNLLQSSILKPIATSVGQETSEQVADAGVRLKSKN
jgi:hypothetical protein